jgi:formylglycine-generating enzyme required for sulfatase activity
VGKKQANPFGLHDMYGNVWEWCQDWYDEQHYGTFRNAIATDPTGPNTRGPYPVYRGACWRNRAGLCRSADRSFGSPLKRDSFLGFRVAQVPSSK